MGMKGLIICAGRGTRLKPFTDTTPKTMLPVVNKPILYYGIEMMAQAGITDIGIVVQPSQYTLISEKAGTGDRFGASLTYIFQEEPKGIADAVAAAESFISGEPFIMLLGDNITTTSLTPLMDQVLHGGSEGCLLLAKVEQPQEYGVAEVDGERVIRLEEKPAVPRSNLAVVGVYAFTSKIFQVIRELKPSKRGELEITDAVQILIEQRRDIHYIIIHSRCTDVGTPRRWLEANAWMMDVQLAGTNRIAEDVQLHDCVIIPPVMIGSGSKLEGCVIGPYVSIQSGAQLRNCKIRESILLDEVQVRDIGSTIQDSVLGSHTMLNGVSMQRGHTSYMLGNHSSQRG